MWGSQQKEQCFLTVEMYWGPSTQIWIPALWMYYSSVLNLAECPSAQLFKLLWCHFFIYYFTPFIGPYVSFLGDTKSLKSKISCSVVLSTNKTVYSTYTTHIFSFSTFFLGSHLYLHWIRHIGSSTHCIWIFQKLIYKHCRSITSVNDAFPSKTLFCGAFHNMSR